MPVRSLGLEYPLEKEMVTHSSILAWEIPWTEKSGGLESMGSQKVGHDYTHVSSLETILLIFQPEYLLFIFLSILDWIGFSYFVECKW